MTTEAMLERTADHPEVPAAPSIALRVLERANHPDCTLGEIAGLIKHDAALTGYMLKAANSALLSQRRAPAAASYPYSELLKIANSALASRPRQVGSVNHALAMLGLKRVAEVARQLVTIAGMYQAESLEPETNQSAATV